jgi:hypothetical protein
VPGLGSVPADVRTVYLGQFLAEHARLIAVELDAREIVWWSKEPNLMTRVWDPGGVHLFVDRAKLQEGKEVAAEVLADDPS